MQQQRPPTVPLVMLIVALCAVSGARAQAPAALAERIQASWCTAPHDDYRRGAPVIEIRQLREARLIDRGAAGSGAAIAARMRSVLVSAGSLRVEFVGAWVEYRFDVLDATQLLDTSIGLALTLIGEQLRVAYKYGGSESYLHRRCGAAEIDPVAGERLPAQISAAQEGTAPQGAAQAREGGESAPSEARVPDTAASPADENARSAQLNRSYCLAMERTAAGFFSLANRCTSAANYTYCIVGPSTANGRLARCAAAAGEQLGVSSGYLNAGERAYLSMPVTDKGQVVWFACEYPATPVLTGTQPSRGYCR